MENPKILLTSSAGVLPLPVLPLPAGLQTHQAPDQLLPQNQTLAGLGVDNYLNPGGSGQGIDGNAEPASTGQAQRWLCQRSLPESSQGTP